MQVSIDPSTTQWFHVCGGTIIDSNTVLSAAHCCNYPNNRISIYAGITKLTDTRGQRLTVFAQRSHPKFIAKPVAFRGDICIIKTNEHFVFDDKVKPAELPMAFGEFQGDEKVTVSGWGALYHQGPSDNKLQYVKLPLIDFDQCYSTYSRPEAKSFPPDRHMFCSGIWQEGGRDACQGDSGGPYMLGDTNILVGIVSYGVGCADGDYPGIATLVSHYINWIERNRGDIPEDNFTQVGRMAPLPWNRGGKNDK